MPCKNERLVSSDETFKATFFIIFSKGTEKKYFLKGKYIP